VELFSQGDGTFFPRRWDFFPKALGLSSQGVGTFFPRRWDFLPKAVGLSSQHGGKEFPPNGTNSLLRGNALKMPRRFEIRREREEEIELLCISYPGRLCAIGFTGKLKFT
jgi:hypothetical protein